MNVSREYAQKRETFLKELFTKNPTLSVRKAQNELLTFSGMTMRPSRILEIRKELTRPKRRNKSTNFFGEIADE